MSYNSIGLSTPRGSGTNGYITANAAHLKREPFRLGGGGDNNNKNKSNKLIGERKANTEILRHEEKRFIELQCMELQDRLEAEAEASLEDQDEDADIQIKVSQLRKRLMTELEAKWAIEDNKHFTESGYEPPSSSLEANHVHEEIDKLLADVSSQIEQKATAKSKPETKGPEARRAVPSSASHYRPSDSRRRSRSPPRRPPRSRTPSPVRRGGGDSYRPSRDDGVRRNRRPSPISDDEDRQEDSSSRRGRDSSSSYRPRYRNRNDDHSGPPRDRRKTESLSRSDRYKPHQTHEIARAKERENDRLKNALRLSG